MLGDLRSRATLVIALALVPLSVGGSRADAPVICAQGRAGEFFVTLLADPSPIRVGTTTFAALVQRQKDAPPLLDARVDLRLEPVEVAVAEGASAAVDSGMTTAASVNRLLYAAPVTLTAAGRWRVIVSVRREAESGVFASELVIAEAEAPLVALWPYLLAPFAVLALYALHQTLARRIRPG